MKVNELMIGDWVYNRVADITFQVYPQFFSQWHDRPEQFEATIQPISLTLKILEKNEFTRFGTDYILKERHFGLENPSIPSNYLDNYWLQVSIKAVHIEYVHELQHALRLCGIDKEIEL